MSEFLEVWIGGRAEVTPLEGERLVVGRTDESALMLNDPAVSRIHAALQHLQPGWTLKDLGSHNGTFLNGNRISGEVVLHDSDEIRIGNTRLVFRVKGAFVSPLERTVGATAPPDLTRREREVLVALVRTSGGSVFRAPAPVKEVAAVLHLTEAAVKQHLSRLYDKFEIKAGSNRRIELANEALSRGAVTLADLSES